MGGEFLAIAESLEDLARKTSSSRAAVLVKGLHAANSRFLDANRNPSRKVKEIDNRGSHFYLAMYWAEAIAGQNEDAELQKDFAGLAKAMKANEEQIMKELIDCQGSTQDIGGYYYPDPTKTSRSMRPSATLNALIDVRTSKL